MNVKLYEDDAHLTDQMAIKRLPLL